MSTTMGNPAYFEKYENLAFARDGEGVLVMRFHTDGGPVVFTGQTHQDLPGALEELSLDRGNKALLRRAGENPGSVVNLSSGSSRQSASDPVDRLAKLADLKERGVLGDDEFAAEKAKILGEG
jgi:hypothetical protein